MRSATSEGLFQRPSGNLLSRRPSICRVLAALWNSGPIPRDGEANQRQLRPIKLLPHDYWSVETGHVQQHSQDRRSKPPYPNSPPATSWVFAARCHTKGGAAMLDVPSTTATALHICILSFSHKNAPLHLHKGTTFSTNGHLRLSD